MPNYITKALLKYKHPATSKPQHAPYKATPIQFRAWVQTVTTDTTAPLSKDASNACKTSSAHSSTTDVQWTPPFSLPSALSHHIRLRAQKPWQMHVINVLIALLRIPKQASVNLQAT